MVQNIFVACDDAGKLSLHLFIPSVIHWPIREAH